MENKLKEVKEAQRIFRETKKDMRRLIKALTGISIAIFLIWIIPMHWIMQLTATAIIAGLFFREIGLFLWILKMFFIGILGWLSTEEINKERPYLKKE